MFWLFACAPTEENYPEVFAEALCDWHVRCDNISEENRATCEETAAGGYFDYDPDRALECLQALDDATCEEISNANRQYDACDNVGMG